VLAIVVATIRAAVDAYLASDDGEAVVAEEDPLIIAASNGDSTLARRAVDILMGEEMTPLGGGGSSSDVSFRYLVGRNVREYRAVTNIDGFIAVQRQLLDLHKPPPLPPSLMTPEFSRHDELAEALGERFFPARWPAAPDPEEPIVTQPATEASEPEEPAAEGPTTASLTYNLHVVLAGEPFKLVTTSTPRLGPQEAWHSLRDLLYGEWPDLRPKDGTDLASAAFSDKSGYVRVGAPGLDEETRRNLQQGVHNLALSVATMLRNPAAHGREGWAPASLGEREYAFGAMALVNTLCWWVQSVLDEQADLAEPPNE
jgi:Protein of unknown function (Hypoth_ymh)